MYKRMLGAAVVAASCCSAQAAPSAPPQWEFSYTGFYDALTDTFDPGFRLSGSFSGADLNSDGAIDQTELTGLRFQGLDFLDCSSANPAGSCESPLFRYTLGGALEPALVWSTFDACCTTAHMFVGSEYITNRLEFGQNYPRSWLATSATVISITPVPEPDQWTLAAAGLAVLWLSSTLRRQLGKRRRHAATFRH